MATPMISAQNVHKSFGQLEVLKGIDLEVQPGEVACFCLLYTSPSPRDVEESRMPSSA